MVDVLTALLADCRAHAAELAPSIQTRLGRSRQVQALLEVRDHMPSLAAVSEVTKAYISSLLTEAENYIEIAYALALGIDLAIRTEKASLYSVMCQGRGVRVLRDLDPYPTPDVPLKQIIPGDGYSRLPRDGGSVLAVDRVQGLALWNSSEYGALQAIYDPIAGKALDLALVSTFDVLVVAPNKELLTEFNFAPTPGPGFFGVAVKDVARQKQILSDALRYCALHGIEILLLPELAATADFEVVIKEALSEADDGASPATSCPSVVVAGSQHVLADGSQVNRLSTIYRHELHTVHHDKVAPYVMGSSEVLVNGKLEPNRWGEEDICRANYVRLHAGVRWSMVPLICADFLDEFVVKAVAALHPKLVLVASMSHQTTDFDRSAGTVISACQAVVVVANGPVEWPSEEEHGTRASIAVVALPVSDPRLATQRINVPQGLAAPYTVHFQSKSRSVRLLSDQVT